MRLYWASSHILFSGSLYLSSRVPKGKQHYCFEDFEENLETTSLIEAKEWKIVENLQDPFLAELI